MLSLCWSPRWEHLTDQPNQIGIIPGSRCNLRTRTVTVNKLDWLPNSMSVWWFTFQTRKAAMQAEWSDVEVDKS